MRARGPDGERARGRWIEGARARGSEGVRVEGIEGERGGEREKEGEKGVGERCNLASPVIDGGDSKRRNNTLVASGWNNTYIARGGRQEGGHRRRCSMHVRVTGGSRMCSLAIECVLLLQEAVQHACYSHGKAVTIECVLLL